MTPKFGAEARPGRAAGTLGGVPHYAVFTPAGPGGIHPDFGWTRREVLRAEPREHVRLRALMPPGFWRPGAKALHPAPLDSKGRQLFVLRTETLGPATVRAFHEEEGQVWVTTWVKLTLVAQDKGRQLYEAPGGPRGASALLSKYAQRLLQGEALSDKELSTYYVTEFHAAVSSFWMQEGRAEPWDGHREWPSVEVRKAPTAPAPTASTALTAPKTRRGKARRKARRKAVRSRAASRKAASRKDARIWRRRLEVHRLHGHRAAVWRAVLRATLREVSAEWPVHRLRESLQAEKFPASWEVENALRLALVAKLTAGLAAQAELDVPLPEAEGLARSTVEAVRRAWAALPPAEQTNLLDEGHGWVVAQVSATPRLRVALEKADPWRALAADGFVLDTLPWMGSCLPVETLGEERFWCHFTPVVKWYYR